MKILIPIKQVPETNAVRMDEATGTMIREGVDAIINPLDLYALELGLRLRERAGGEVVALTMGPPRAIEALREAVAMGADHAVLLSDKAFAGSDTWATSLALAAAIRKLAPYDLIICGERATDGDTGQVGPGIAAWLDLPLISYVAGVSELTPRMIQARRLVEEGYEDLEMDLPGLITVVKEAAAPRLPTLRGKQRARRLNIPVWGPDDLGLTATQRGLVGSPTRVVKIFRPKISRQAHLVKAPDAAAAARAAQELAAWLASRHLLPAAAASRAGQEVGHG
ncbi:MAG: Electron transfer flavoprotein, beta subunit [Candidatus Ozemobacter sibiricus]|jgi:electron transfer flavoprotein beta subunit|uniref:Electron transfer flavoprotein, beta subunit n=1 Tax=Candidatus Ozemobacter sibiricus TaxID=2268124 RepID=A0A367ZSP7_9BACT|nr:MAG: Electron transfer flavoprotein, beta subunit [Candidatus Ozemobacter sibiricus]